MEVLKIDCCWVQLFRLDSRDLWLAAYRGFTPDMEREIGSTDVGQSFGNQVAGLEYKIIIPDLSHDKEYGLLSFSEAGKAQYREPKDSASVSLKGLQKKVENEGMVKTVVLAVGYEADSSLAKALATLVNILA